MRRYKSFGGVTFSGQTFAGVVADMRRFAWLVGVPKSEYMEDVSQTIGMLTHGRVTIPTERPKVFIEALVAEGFLKEDA
jgi:hypothetical protein